MTDGEHSGGSLVGAVLEGAYRLTRLVGEGGMGAVYEAQQLRLKKRVAVKVMARDLAANTEALARFHREAEVTSQLGHPHIVSVVDFGTAETGEPYLVMEFLEGEDLDHRIHRVGKMGLAAMIHVVKQVASALSATHAKGIVHRDLKPANVFLLAVEGESDFVKVVDFGISKVKASATKLTRASVVMGTPNYMSPEQASGRIDEIDARTDQWALACIAWEMLAGTGPFTGEEIASLLYQVIHQDPPSLAAKVPGLPSEVEQVLRRALTKDPTKRFPTVVTFARELEAAAVAPPAPAPARSAARAIPAKKETIPYDGRLARPAQGRDPGHAAAAFEATVFGEPLAKGAAPQQPTTFSRTAGEITRSARRPGSVFRAPWAFAAAGGVAVLLVIALLVFRRPTSATSTSAAGGAAPAPVARAAGTPSAAPPTTAPLPIEPVLAPAPSRRAKGTEVPPRRVGAAAKVGRGGAVTAGPFSDPFGPQTARSKRTGAGTGTLGASPTNAPATKPAKPKRRLIEDL